MHVTFVAFRSRYIFRTRILKRYAAGENYMQGFGSEFAAEGRLHYADRISLISAVVRV